jgi:hypothetical protein
MEACMVRKGLTVTAVPLDPIISGSAASKGVEIVDGDFEEVQRRLQRRRFDCLLLSNVLHLVADPVAVLRAFAGLLSPRGLAIAVIPNTSRLEGSWRAIRGREVCDRGRFQETGAQWTSRGTVCKWFEEAGLSISAVREVLNPGAQSVSRATNDLVKSWLADEFVVKANRVSGANEGARITQDWVGLNR